MPIASPAGALRMRQRGSGDERPVRAVRLPAVVFPPRTFVRVGVEMPAAYPMMNTELGTAQPREERFGLVGAGAGRRDELDRMVDPHHREAGVKDVPLARFISVDDRVAVDGLPDQRHGRAFRWDNPGDRSALTLAGDHDNLLLRILAALLPPIGLAVLGADARAEIGAINLGLATLAAQLLGRMDLGAHRLAQLVQHDEGRFRVDVHVARHLQRRGALHAVAEQGDDREMIADAEFPAMEERTAGNAEFLAAPGALPPDR